MRVTHVITRLIVGGAQENTVSSVIGLRQKPGLEVDLISGPTVGPEGSLEGSLAGMPGALRILPTLVRPVHPVNDIRALLTLTKMFREDRPAIVHTHSGKAGVLGRLAARHASVPVVIHTIHGPSFGPFQGPISNCLFRGAERLAGSSTTHFVVVAEAMAKQYLAAGIGRSEQYSRVFSGFDLAPFLNAKNDAMLRQKLGIGPEDFVIGKIARLFKLKGHDDLIAIAPGIIAARPEAKFLLVGDGAWRQRLEEKVESLGLRKHFVFTGLVPPTEVAQYVGVMDLLVHLSTREGLPRALPQALAAGKPVVAYDADGASEVCLHGQTGWLVRPHDLTSLEVCILKLLNDAEMRNRFGAAGRVFVAERFPTQRMVDDLHALYLRLRSS